ncbi:MAG: nitroreductase family protein [Alphaproteobacteria bacterium]|nr:nitroreductase family protein [Alphaproteobacteria bacterium]
MARSSSYQPVPLPDYEDVSPDISAERARGFFETMAKRHSVRQFDTKEVDEAVIRHAIATAGRAPSGANHQPWHFVAIRDHDMKARIREAAEKEEREFYAGGGGDEWIAALEPIGTGPTKTHLTDAPWLIIVFAQRYGLNDDGTRYKHYYVPESVGISTGVLVTALHMAGLACLIHTPNPMKFLNGLCGRPAHEKPVMIIPVGYPDANAVIPKAATIKKPLDEILTVL